jgi:hypothetical protein
MYLLCLLALTMMLSVVMRARIADITRTNVPMTRVDFRARTLRAELTLIHRGDDL